MRLTLMGMGLPRLKGGCFGWLKESRLEDAVGIEGAFDLEPRVVNRTVVRAPRGVVGRAEKAREITLASMLVRDRLRGRDGAERVVEDRGRDAERKDAETDHA